MQSYRLSFWPRWRHEAGDGSDEPSSLNSPIGESSAHADGQIDAPAIFANLAGFQEIYSSAHLRDPKPGYNILKIAEMLQSEHIRSLAPDARRGSLLMALEAAHVQVGEVVRDAREREKALSAYEALQQKRLQEFDAFKRQQAAEMQEELDQVTAEYQARIKASHAEVQHQQERFRAWKERKLAEVRRLNETVAFCAGSAEKPLEVLAVATGPSD
jgi:vacuolar-type H+-ATPase subunit I/STV1